MPKRKGRGRGPLRRSRAGKFQKSEDDNLDIPDSPLEIVQVEGYSGFEEEQAAGMVMDWCISYPTFFLSLHFSTECLIS